MTVQETANSITVQLICPWKDCDKQISVTLTFVSNSKTIDGSSEDGYTYTATLKDQEVTCASGHVSTVSGGLSVVVKPKKSVRSTNIKQY